MAPQGKRAGRLETLGAWLGIWTPPRDVEVPPVPWRRLLAIGAPLFALAAVGLWLVLDGASESRRADDARDARERAAQLAERRARLRADQAVHRASAGPAERSALVGELERAVLADARKRFGRAEVENRARRVECEPHPRTAGRRAAERDPAQRSGRYRCLAVTADVSGPRSGSVGYLFIGRIAYRSGALVWCKANPPPGELAIPDPDTVVALPRPCR